jgi:hypothetical protein
MCAAFKIGIHPNAPFMQIYYFFAKPNPLPSGLRKL